VEQLKKKYLFLANLSTSSSSQKLVILLFLGLILIGFGALSFKIGLFGNSDTIEVLNNTLEPQNTNFEVVVEITGSIEKPGVYKLPNNSRIDDLLTVSGGLSVNADRDWVSKNINRASKLIDGQKIYIYSQSEVASAKESGGIKPYQEVIGYSAEGLVNINIASEKELDSLVGIGPVYAQKIIEQRPYSNLEELVTKAKIPAKTFDKIKNDISL